MSMMPPFTPGATVSATSGAGTSSVATPLGKPTGANVLGGAQMMVTSESGGTQTKAFFKFGDSSVAAAITDTPILPGVQAIFTAPAAATHVAVIASAATLVYFTSGIGE